MARGEVNAAKTHCPKGHPYSGPNVIITKAGGRACRACRVDSGLLCPSCGKGAASDRRGAWCIPCNQAVLA